MNIYFVVVLFVGAFGVIVQTGNLLNDETDRNGSFLERRRLVLRSVHNDRVVQESCTPNSMVTDESLNAYHQPKRDTTRNDAESGAPAVGDGSVGDSDEAGDESGGGEGPHISSKFEHFTDALRVNTEWLQRTSAVGTDPEAGDEVGAGGQTGVNTGTETRNETVSGNCAGAEEAVGTTVSEAPPGDFHVHLEMSFPGHKRILTAKDATWQNVSGTKEMFRVYSAFYDRRGNRTVRIIGASTFKKKDRVWCRLWYKTDDALADGSGGITNQSCFIVVPAEVQNSREGNDHVYVSVFVLCALGRKLAAPSAVSVVSGLHRPPANLLLVRNTDADLAARNLMAWPVGGEPPPVPQGATANSVANPAAGAPLSRVAHVPDTIAMCVKLLHSKYNQAMRILEFFELNAILGVQHFTMYNFSVGDQVSCVLRDYVERGIVTLLPWDFDTSMKDIHLYAMFSSIHDCVYRNMYKYKYAAVTDVDEFLIPRNHSTLQELIKFIDSHVQNHRLGSYVFQNFFFYLVWDDDPELQGASLLERELITLRKLRKALANPHSPSPKYIGRPDVVVEPGNHVVLEFVPGYRTFNVTPDVAILQHYRFCKDNLNCDKEKWVTDKTAYRYRDRLVQRVRERYRNLQLRCNLPPSLDDPMTPTPTRPPPDASRAVSLREYAALLSPLFSAVGNLLFRIGFSLLLLLL